MEATRSTLDASVHAADSSTRLAVGLKLMLCAISLATAVGCHQHKPMMHDDRAAVPWEEGQPWRQVESSVMLTPEAQMAMAEAGYDADAPAWYDSRNDQQAGVVAPNQTRVVYQRSVTYTRDYYGTSNGRVRDQSHTHTYNLRIEESIP